MTLGKVTSFDPARGYGFVRAADNPREIFIARSALERSGMSTLSQGQELAVLFLRLKRSLRV